MIVTVHVVEKLELELNGKSELQQRTSEQILKQYIRLKQLTSSRNN